MRLLLIALSALIAACGPSVPVNGIGAADPAGVPADASRPQLALFVGEGGFLVPLPNGGRVAIANGWIEPRFRDCPSGARCDLDVLVVSAATGAPTLADVVVTAEMLEMGHGSMAHHASMTAVGHHVARLDLSMVGTWRFVVRVRLDGVTSDAVLLLRQNA